MRGISIGRLSEYVTFWREASTDDGMGGEAVQLTSVLTCWAEVRVPSSRDGVIGGRDIEIRSHVVTIRDNTGVDIVQGDRAEWRGNMLVVKAVRPDHSRGVIQFDCVQYVEGE